MRRRDEKWDACEDRFEVELDAKEGDIHDSSVLG